MSSSTGAAGRALVGALCWAQFPGAEEVEAKRTLSHIFHSVNPGDAAVAPWAALAVEEQVPMVAEKMTMPRTFISLLVPARVL